MRPAVRVAINTTAQYLRTIVNVVIGLYVTKVILNALGEDDFGVYSLVAGVVSMLSFVTAAMSTTTQRFLSYHQTHSTRDYLAKVFSNSLMLHIGVAIVALVILEIIGVAMFDSWLNIPAERISAAKVVYHLAIVMVIFVFISSPFNALLIAHENLVFTSIVSVIDSFLKLGVAFWVKAVSYDQLIFYAILMCGISFVNFILFASYALTKYEESRKFDYKHYSGETIKEISKFAGWTIYGTACTIGRTQGTAIVINKVWATAANAAYGVATQIYGAILFVGSSLMSAIAPQIIKAEGAGDRKRMLRLSETASKLCFLLLASVAVPIIINIETILSLWLGAIPPHCKLMCQVVLTTGLCDYITYGLNTVNGAIGRLKLYNSVVYTTKFITVPVMAVMVYCNIDLSEAFWTYAVFELISALLRIPILHKQASLAVGEFCKNVILRVIFPVVFISVCCYLSKEFATSLASNIVYIVIAELMYMLIIYLMALNHWERRVLQSVIRKSNKKEELCRPIM